MVSFVALPLIALVLLLGLVGIVAMLIHPKTRAAGAVLLAVGAVMVVAAAVAVVFFGHFNRERRMVEEVRVEAQWQKQQVQEDGGARAIVQWDRVHEAFEPEKAPTEPTPNEPTDPAAETTKSPPRTTSGRVLNGLLTSVSRAVTETKAEEEEKPARTGSDSETVPVVEEAPAPIPELTPLPAPAWVGKGLPSVTNNYSVAIAIGPCPSLAKCEAELPAAVERAVAQYVDEMLGHGPQIAAELQLPAGFIADNRLVRERWTGPHVFDKPIAGYDGSWTQMHVLLVFDAEAKRQIDQQCKSVIVADRLWYTGTGIAALLAVLAVLFGCLRIDQVTTGSHRGLLVTAAVVAVAAIVAGGYFALRPTAPESLTPESIATEHFTTSHPASAVAPASEDGAMADGGMADGAAQRSAAGLRVKVILLPIAAVVVGLLVLMLAARRTRAAALVLLALVAAGVLAAKIGPIAPLHGSVASVGSMELAALIVLGVPILLISMFCREGWGWILGFLVCLAAGAFLTPPDPLSMVVVAAPLCGVYGATGLAWRAHRNRKVAGEPTPT